MKVDTGYLFTFEMGENDKSSLLDGDHRRPSYGHRKPTWVFAISLSPVSMQLALGVNSFLLGLVIHILFLGEDIQDQTFDIVDPEN